MESTEDSALLRQYAENSSDDAFAALVTRHVNLVYSVATRQVGNPHHAEEITQAVFIILTKKAAQLRHHQALSSWLFQTTRLTANNFLRSETRRLRREQEAYMQSVLNESGDDVWPKIAPLLDSAVANLREKDRRAILLRFYEGRNLREVGKCLQINEDAAEKRVSRALEKLRQFFSRRGVVVPATLLTAAISANSVQAAPAVLAKTATAVAFAKGATASTSTLALIKGVTKVMAWAQAKTALAVSAAVILAVGSGATLAFQNQQANKGRIDLPAADWRFAGYGDPASTLQTLAWAITQRDGKTMFDCLSPECQKEFREVTAQMNPPTTAEEFLMRKWAHALKGIRGLSILKTEVLRTNQVLVNLSIQGDNSGSQWIKFQKFSEEWRIEDFDPKGGKGRTGFEHPNPKYGGIGVALGFDTNSHTVHITGVLPNSPAAHAGLTSGLVIQKVNGTSMTGKTLAEAVFFTRGRVGTTVLLELFDPKRNQTNVVELTRQGYTFTTKK